jgi:hypothetical protein
VSSILDKDKMATSPEGMQFGTVAVRTAEGFATTGRGKREADEVSFVLGVDHRERMIKARGHKATLNAPLLDWIFTHNPEAYTVEHYHLSPEDIFPLPVQPWAPPGTVRDTERDVSTSFYIKDHGCVVIRDENGQRL